MWTETAEGRKYIEKFSKTIVSEVAPDELEFFDELVAEYYEDPSPQASKDAALGFGVGGLAVVTPAVIAMLTTVLSYLLAEVTPEVIKRTLDDIIKREEQEAQKEAGAVSLTKEQLDLVMKIARREAGRHGVEATVAANLAKAVVGAIVLAD